MSLSRAVERYRGSRETPWFDPPTSVHLKPKEPPWGRVGGGFCPWAGWTASVNLVRVYWEGSNVSSVSSLVDER